ncbi:unnamed protein product [Penicillium salamii]|uniref:Uncharacterized protein n=1 Tax=Penicillium salamii TaxID=1612424 RepID=A0A9W4JMB6_9EURO|nr:unnamed protein product [Penicillium salamii]CAG8286816.1 unnamed protein product [Penicillium salamii]CAG8331065.1 unnamed protein product [Penicillium salamii]CAG8352483.1 unnamed protein product [Penicillium salamii]CAG8357627.1 unnamed protein product [Penicillium salamii]
MAPTPFEEYAALMKPYGDGHYLYKPQPYSKVHPGVIGFFDKQGSWTTITDLSIPGQSEKDGYTKLGVEWNSDEPELAKWNSRASSQEAAHSFGVDAGVSGLAAGGPVDVSAEAKNKWGQTGKAALFANDSVINQKYSGAWKSPIADWVKVNAKALVNSPWKGDLKEHGLWAIKKTWSTQECKITLDSAHHRDTSGGFKVGATGVAEGGLSGSSAVKGDSAGWTTFTASDKDQGLVVSYGGSAFRVSAFTKLFTHALLKQVESRAAPEEVLKPVFDADGNQIGTVRARVVYDNDGNQRLEEIDEEAERKEKEAKDRKLIEEGDAEEVVDIEIDEDVGETEEDLELEKQYQASKETELKERNEKIAALQAADLPADVKAAELKKLFNVTEEVTVI